MQQSIKAKRERNWMVATTGRKCAGDRARDDGWGR